MCLCFREPCAVCVCACVCVCVCVCAVGLASSRYSPELVFSAFAMTAAVSTGLCIYAMRTKTDFTMMGGFLHSMLMCFLLTIIIACFFNVPIMG